MRRPYFQLSPTSGCRIRSDCAPGDFGKARQNVAVGDRAAVPEGRQPVSRLKASGLKTGSQRSQDWKPVVFVPNTFRLSRYREEGL